MARSHRFEQYIVTGDAKSSSPSRAIKRQEKQAVSRSMQKAKAGGAKPRISYGKKFAESTERYQEHHQQYEELEAKRAHEAVMTGKAQPIGAIPGVEEPQIRTGVAEVFDRARRDVRRMRNAVEDFFDATGHVVRIPGEVLRVAIRRFRPA